MRGRMVRPIEQVEVQRHQNRAVPKVDGVRSVPGGLQPPRQFQRPLALRGDAAIDDERRGDAERDEPFEHQRTETVRLTRHRELDAPVDSPDQAGENHRPTEARAESLQDRSDRAPREEFHNQRAEQHFGECRRVKWRRRRPVVLRGNHDGPSHECERCDAPREYEQQRERGVEDDFVHERPRGADVSIVGCVRCQGQPRQPLRILVEIERRPNQWHREQHDQPEQRIDAPEPAEKVAGDRTRPAERVGLRVRDNEAGNHEEEIDAGEAEPAEGPEEFAGDAEMALAGAEVNPQHQQAGDAPEALQIVEFRGHCP